MVSNPNNFKNILDLIALYKKYLNDNDLNFMPSLKFIMSIQMFKLIPVCLEYCIIEQ